VDDISFRAANGQALGGLGPGRRRKDHHHARITDRVEAAAGTVSAMGHDIRAQSRQAKAASLLDIVRKKG